MRRSRGTRALACAALLVMANACASSGGTVTIVSAPSLAVNTDASGDALFPTAVFVVLDASGNAIPGATVSIACTSEQGNLGCAFGPATVRSDANGFAIVASALASGFGSAATSGGVGQVSLTATYGSSSAVAKLRALPPARHIVFVAGNNQAQPRSGSSNGQPATFVPLVLTLSDENGIGIPNTSVQLTCNAPGCTLTKAGTPTATLATDVTGTAVQAITRCPWYATLSTGFFIDAPPGTYTVTASSQGFASVTVPESVLAPASPPSCSTSSRRQSRPH